MGAKYIILPDFREFKLNYGLFKISFISACQAFVVRILHIDKKKFCFKKKNGGVQLALYAWPHASRCHARRHRGAEVKKVRF